MHNYNKSDIDRTGTAISGDDSVAEGDRGGDVSIERWSVQG